MVGVAFYTGLFLETMIALLQVDVLFYFFVTAEAQCLIDSLAGVVTFEAVRSFEIFVAFDQWSGREHPIHDAFAFVGRPNTIGQR